MDNPESTELDLELEQAMKEFNEATDQYWATKVKNDKLRRISEGSASLSVENKENLSETYKPGQYKDYEQKNIDSLIAEREGNLSKAYLKLSRFMSTKEMEEKFFERKPDGVESFSPMKH